MSSASPAVFGMPHCEFTGVVMRVGTGPREQPQELLWKLRGEDGQNKAVRSRQKRNVLSGCCHTVVLMQVVTKDSLR